MRRRARATGASYYLHRSFAQLQFAVMQQVMLSRVVMIHLQRLLVGTQAVQKQDNSRQLQTTTTKKMTMLMKKETGMLSE